ncbi:MAG: bacterio-opsin activator domain-containing protein, partial [Haloferacaceae archaeon]
ADEDAVRELRNVPVVHDCTTVADRDGVCLLECTMDDDSLVAWLLDHGAVPVSLSTGDGARVTVELFQGADVRDFVDLFRTRYPGTELIARRERERAVQIREGFRSEFEEQVTPRQQEILRTAYASGFFDTPRPRTGQEVASSLGITQPTFSEHLRTALRRLLTTLYQDGGSGDADRPDDR